VYAPIAVESGVAEGKLPGLAKMITTARVRMAYRPAVVMTERL